MKYTFSFLCWGVQFFCVTCVCVQVGCRSKFTHFYKVGKFYQWMKRLCVCMMGLKFCSVCNPPMIIVIHLIVTSCIALWYTWEQNMTDLFSNLAMANMLEFAPSYSLTRARLFKQMIYKTPVYTQMHHQ